MTTSHGGDYLVGICDPLEGFRLGIVIVEESVDGSLEVGDGSEHPAFESRLVRNGKKAFDGVSQEAEVGMK